MSRLPLPSDIALPDDSRALLAQRAPVAVYRMAAWSPVLLPPFMAFANALFERTVLSDMLREAVILRVAMHHACEYEAHHHHGLAVRAGLSEADIAALLSPAPWHGGDALVRDAVRFTDEIITSHRPSVTSFTATELALGSRGTVELAMLIGFYQMVASFIGGTGVELDARTAVELRGQSQA